MRKTKDIQDTVKWSNIHIIGILNGEEKENEVEAIFENIMAKNFPKLRKIFQFTDFRGSG